MPNTRLCEAATAHAQVYFYEDPKLLKLFADTVRVLYDHDILGEDSIRHWFKSASPLHPHVTPTLLHASLAPVTLSRRSWALMLLVYIHVMPLHICLDPRACMQVNVTANLLECHSAHSVLQRVPTPRAAMCSSVTWNPSSNGWTKLRKRMMTSDKPPLFKPVVDRVAAETAAGVSLCSQWWPAASRRLASDHLVVSLPLSRCAESLCLDLTVLQSGL